TAAIVTPWASRAAASCLEVEGYEIGAPFRRPEPMKRLLFPLLAFSLGACVSVSRTMLTEEYMDAPVPPGRVDVLMASLGDSSPRDCVRVAIMHASGPQDATDEGDFLEELRKKAGEVGANT